MGGSGGGLGSWLDGNWVVEDTVLVLGWRGVSCVDWEGGVERGCADGELGRDMMFKWLGSWEWVGY